MRTKTPVQTRPVAVICLTFGRLPIWIRRFLNDAIQNYNIGFTLTPKYDVAVIKLVYETIDKNGDPATASGALVIPQDGDNTLPLLSYHHGTEPKRSQVASVSPLFVFESLIYASSGFLTCTPDYLGLGESQEVHPYLIADLSASATIDMLRATRAYCCEQGIALNEKLFLSGYSEGGFVTLATHETLETDYSDEFSVTASTPMAGPYDLMETARILLTQPEYPHPSYFGYIITAYSDVYGWDRFDEIFQAPYADLIPELFDGTYSSGYIESQLTSNITELVTSEFINGFLGDGEQALKTALRENSPLNWTPRVPIHFIHAPPMPPSRRKI